MPQMGGTGGAGEIGRQAPNNFLAIAGGYANIPP